jgi:tetratricopeptide (TPR) repeat protein
MRKLSTALVLFLVVPCVADGNQESARLRAAAFQLAYNLDYAAATREMEAAARADPKDAAAERGLAVIPWLLISFTRGAATVDDYLGSISKENVAMREPPADLAKRFKHHSAKALQLAEADLKARPRDPAALYELGAIVGLQAAYVATVEGKVVGAFRSSLRAYETHEDVLKLDPSRKDAGLIVGTYRYIVSEMPLLVRIVAKVAGFDGDKQQGLRMIEEASASSTEASVDAKFALVLLYNRESRHANALRVLAGLQQSFPRNRLLWLEGGATALRAGSPADAEQQLSAGLKMMATADSGTRMFGEEALWLQKRGAARVALDRPADAEADLRRSLTLESRKWVAGRAHAELGKLADLKNDRPTARSHFERAVSLAKEDNDSIGRDAAQRWVKTPFKR